MTIMTIAKILAEKCAEAEISKQAGDGFFDKAVGAVKDFTSTVADKYNTDDEFKTRVHGAGIGALALGAAGGVYGAAKGKTRASPGMTGKQKAKIYAGEILRGIMAGAAVGGAGGAWLVSGKQDKAREKQKEIDEALAGAGAAERSAISRRTDDIDGNLGVGDHAAILGAGLHDGFNWTTIGLGAGVGAVGRTAGDMARAPNGTGIIDALTQGQGLHRLRRMVDDRGSKFGWGRNAEHQNAYLRTIGATDRNTASELSRRLQGATPQQAQNTVRNYMARPEQQAYLRSDAYTRVREELRIARDTALRDRANAAARGDVRGVRAANNAWRQAESRSHQFGADTRARLRGMRGNFDIGADPHIGKPPKAKTTTSASTTHTASTTAQAGSAPPFVPARQMAVRMAAVRRLGGGAARGVIAAVVLDGLHRYINAVFASNRVVR
jgi:hypothetical protein